MLKKVAFEFDNGQDAPYNITSVGGLIYSTDEWEAFKAEHENDESFVIHSEEVFLPVAKNIEVDNE